MARRSRTRPRAATEWIGGTVTMPVPITGEGESYRPELLLWLDPANEIVLGFAVARPDELLEDAVASLRETIAAPAAGPPGPPARLRVDSDTLAGALRGALPELEIVVAATPEVDAVGAALAESLSDEPERGWLDEGHAPEAVGGFFDAMAELWRVAPWEVLPGEEASLLVTIEAFGVRDAVAVVIGQMGESFGVLLFASVADRERYVTIGEAMRRGAARGERAAVEFESMPPHTALSFDPIDEVVPTSRDERETHGWALAADEAFPSLLCLGEGLVERSPTPRDLALAEALARVVARAVDEDGDIFVDAWLEGESAERTLTVETSEGRVEATLRLPEPDETEVGGNEVPERIYRLKIELEEINGGVPDGEVSRTVDCAGEHTLWDLHGIVQQAFDWDDDHLFVFHVSGRLRDRRSEYVGGPMGDVESWSGEPRSVEETRLDDLGLKRRRVMRYVFDEHIVHKITVSTIRDGGEDDVDLPRLIARVGRAPPQYGLGDEYE